MSNDTHGFLPLPATTITTNDDLNHQQEPPSITQESQLAAALGRAIFNIRDAVAAATTITNPIISRTSSDITPSLNNNQDQPSKPTTTTPRKTRRRHPFRRTTDKKECPQIKRLRKMEEMVTEIEQKCSEFTRESEEVVTQEQEQCDGDGDDENVIETNVEQDEEDKEESVEFKRLDDGRLRIQMSCSCSKRFEILHNQIGCFYRLI